MESGLIDRADQPERELLPGVRIRTAWGEKLMVSVVTFEPEAVVPEHSHPHEQMGMGLAGTFELTVDGKAHRIGPGDIYLVPGNVKHSARAFAEPVTTLDLFSPPREEYKS